MIIPVVMYVDHSVKLGILSNVQFCFTLDTFGQSLSGIFLHLDVKEFPVSKQTKKSVMRSFGKQIDKKNSVAPSCQRMSFAFIETVATYFKIIWVIWQSYKWLDKILAPLKNRGQGSSHWVQINSEGSFLLSCHCCFRI